MPKPTSARQVLVATCLLISPERSSVQNAFISGARFTSQNGIDVADGFIYWTNGPGIVAGEVTGSIGRASVDGSGVAQFFISPLFNPNSIDVDSAGPKPAAPGSQGSGPPPQSPHVPPVLAEVSSSNSSFAPGGASTSTRFRPLISAQASKAVPRGTVFSFKLDQDAAVTIEVMRRNGGRMVLGKCKALRKNNRKKKRCDIRAHSALKGDGKAGKNEVPYSGRVNGKALKPGLYEATFIAVNSSGEVAKPVSVGFRIVKP